MIPDEVGHDSAAAAALRIQWRYIRHRDIELEIQIFIPLRIAIKDGASKTLCPELASIAVNSGGSSPKFSALEQSSVMVQVRNSNFESPILDTVQHGWRDAVSALQESGEQTPEAYVLHRAPSVHHRIAVALRLNVV